MRRYEPSRAAPVVVVLLILALLTATYFSAYFLLGEAHYSFTSVDLLEGVEEPESYGDKEVWRANRSERQATIFQPAKWVESWLTGKSVEVVGPSRIGTDFNFSVEAGE